VSTNAQGAAQSSVDWDEWHSSYEQADSELSARLALVQAQVSAALERAPEGPIRAISVCAGQGHDLIGVLVDHPRRADVRARLVELDEQNVARARAAVAAVGLEAIEVVAADASVTDAYEGAVPAQIVLVCGVFGNISAADVDNTIEHLPELCASAATVVWTRHRNPPDLVPHMLQTFERAGFELLALDDAGPFAIGAHSLRGQRRALRSGVRLFEFIAQGALWPHLDEDRRAALAALFRPDCSLVELVEAIRALPLGLPSAPTAQSMLREARGTSAAKHLFLAEVAAARFPATEPVLVHRVYRLTPTLAAQIYGDAVAETVPEEGLIDVHRYMTATIDGRRIAIDATLRGPRWDGHSGLEPACGEGRDFPAGADPDADLRALEREHCDEQARAPFLAALTRAGLPVTPA
jgi:hypothetical protein